MNTGFQRCLIIILLSVTALSLSYAQSPEPAYVHYTVREGLPSSTVYHILQDRHGFIWFGTDAGVARFDGKEFEVFTITNGLPDNDILRMFEDTQGRIWFLCYNGKLGYFKNEKLFHPGNDLLLARLSQTQPWFSAMEERAGRIWFRSRNGLTLLDGDKIFNCPDAPAGAFQSGNVGDIIWKEESRIYTLASSISKVSCYPELSILPSTSICKTEKGSVAARVGFCQHHGLVSVCPNGQVQSFVDGKSRLIWQSKSGKFPSHPNEIKEDKAGNIWIADGVSGVYYIANPSIKQSPAVNFLSGENASALLIDNESSLWVSTLGNGVFYLGNTEVQSFGGMNGKMPVFSILSTHFQTLLISTTRNIFQVTHGNQIKDLKGLPERLGEGTKFRLFNLSYPNFWISGPANNLLCNCTRARIVCKEIPELKSSYLNGIHEYSNDSIFICSNFKTQVWTKGGKFIDIQDSSGNDIPSNCALGLGGLKVLIGTKTGLYEWNGNKTTKSNLLQSDNSSNISFLLSGNKTDEIWIGTTTSGVWHCQGARCEIINEKNGLSGNICKTALCDPHGVLWIGTNRGLTRIEKTISSQNRIDKIGVTDGLPSEEIHSLAFHNDTLVIGTNTGFTYLPTSLLLQNNREPNVFIRSLQYGDALVVSQDPLSLPFQGRDIKIRFTGIDFKSMGDLTFEYRLNGSGEWSLTQGREVVYPQLEPGKYAFEVYAVSSDNQKSKTPAIINFEILPAWYQTAWFRIFILGCIIAIAIIMLMLRIRSINKENAYKLKLSELKTMALGLQMNPHFVFNCLNSIHHYITSGEKEEGRSYLAKFGKLLREILQNSTENEVTVESEIKLLDLYLSLEKIRMGERLRYEIHADEVSKWGDIYIPPMLIQPFVENSIWHGLNNKKGLGKLDVRIALGSGFVSVEIEDDGIGRKASFQNRRDKDKKSISTESIRERLELLGNRTGIRDCVKYTDIERPDSDEFGTIVSLKIPITSN